MKNNQGFTIVELVIVIAVVAILAAVLIPTFSAIIKRASISSDIQTARNMGVILTAEKPQNAYEAVAALKKNGFERLHPKTKFYSFFWIQSKNIVVLTAEGVRPIFPEEMADAIFDPDDWFDLTDAYNAPETTEEEVLTSEPPISPEPPEAPTQCRVTYKINNEDYLDLSQCVFPDTVPQGQKFSFTVAPKSGNYVITKILIVMRNGENESEITNRDPITDPMEFVCGNATGDIEVSITVEEAPPAFVNVTFTCNKPEYLAEPLVNTTVSYGSTFRFNIPLAEGQYWITKLTVYQGGKQLKTDYLSAGESYSSQGIKMTDDLEINVHVVKYCIVTFKGEGIKTNHDLKVEWGIGALFEEGDLQKYFVPSGYEIVSVTAKMGENTLNNVYDPERKILHLSKITADTEVKFEFREKSNN